MSKRPTAAPKKSTAKPVHLASLSDDESEVSSISEVSDYSEVSEYSEGDESVETPPPVKKSSPTAKKSVAPEPSTKGKGKGSAKATIVESTKKPITKETVVESTKKPIAKKKDNDNDDNNGHVHIGRTPSGLEIYHAPNGYYCEYNTDMNDSFSRRFGPGQLLINGTVFNNHVGKCCVLLDSIPLIFDQNSTFMNKYYRELVEFINTEDLNKSELPGIMIASRPVNPNSKFHEFNKHIFDVEDPAYNAVVGAFYDPEHDTIVLTSGSVAHLNESSRAWLVFTFIREDETYGQHAVDAMDAFLTKNFVNDRITKYVYVPNNVWIEDYDNLSRMLSIVVLGTMVQHMAPILEQRLLESVRRRDEILAKQAAAAKVDEELPKDLPSKAPINPVADNETDGESIDDSSSPKNQTKSVEPAKKPSPKEESADEEESPKPKARNRPAPVASDNEDEKPARHRNKGGNRKRK